MTLEQLKERAAKKNQERIEQTQKDLQARDHALQERRTKAPEPSGSSSGSGNQSAERAPKATFTVAWSVDLRRNGRGNRS